MPPSIKDGVEKQAPAGTFVKTIAAMNDNQVVNDLDDALRDATRAAIMSSQKSKIVLELTIIPNGTGAGDTPLVKITDKIKVSLPKPARVKEPVFFADDEFNPTRRNPNQEEMRLESIEGGLNSKPQQTEVEAKVSASGK